MKKVFLNVMLICLVFVAVSCGGGLKSKVIGTWEMTKVEGEAPKQSFTLTLSKDGTYEVAAAGQTQKGKYELNEKEKVLTLKDEKGKEEKITDVKIEKDILSAVNGGQKAEFTKKK